MAYLAARDVHRAKDPGSLRARRFTRTDLARLIERLADKPDYQAAA